VSQRTYLKRVFMDGGLLGAVLVGHGVNAEAGLLHNFIRTRQSFAVTPEQLAAGPVSWGRILHENRMVGRIAPARVAA